MGIARVTSSIEHRYGCRRCDVRQNDELRTRRSWVWRKIEGIREWRNFWLLGKLRRSGLADLLNLNRAKPKWEEKSELDPGNPREWLGEWAPD